MPKRGQTGLQKRTILLDDALAPIVGKGPGERVSPLELNRGLAAYLRDRGLVSDGWTVKIDDRLSEITGLRAGSAIDRRALLKSLWSYIKAHGLQVADDSDKTLDRAFEKAKKVAKQQGLNFTGWDIALIAGAIVLALVLLLHGRAPSGSQPLGTQPPPGGSKQPPG